MASTYTQNTGIEQPGSGEQSGTWGTTTNTNFDIIDQALHGQASIAISGSRDLTTNDGSTSEGANTVIVLTGTPGSTFELRVTPTDAEKFYTIRNETDAACRVIYKGVTYSSSTGVEIASNSTQAVTGDGGGSSGVFKSLTPNTDLVGDTTPQLGGNLDVNGNSIISSASNADVTIAPNGTGDLKVDADRLRLGDQNSSPATLTTNGTADLKLNTNNGTNSGSVVISEGANNNVTLTANGTGKVELASDIQINGTTNNWTIEVDADDHLIFKYNGTAVLAVQDNGAVIAKNDVTAFGTPD